MRPLADSIVSRFCPSARQKGRRNGNRGGPDGDATVVDDVVVGGVMPTLDELRDDHEALRQGLSHLRGLLRASEAPDIVQAVEESLVNLLDAHIQREQVVLRPYAHRIRRVLKEYTLGDHEQPEVVLHDLQALFSTWQAAPTETLGAHLCQLLVELQERLGEEERDFFPIVEHADDRVRAIWNPGRSSRRRPERGRLLS